MFSSISEKFFFEEKGKVCIKITLLRGWDMVSRYDMGKLEEDFSRDGEAFMKMEGWKKGDFNLARALYTLVMELTELRAEVDMLKEERM